MGKIIKKQVERYIELLKQCQQFKHWSKTALSKLFYNWKREKLIKNQVLYKQGDACSRIFVVVDGEFQQTITEEVKKPAAFQHRAYTGPEDIREKVFSVQEGIMKVAHRYNQAHVAIIGKGVMMGDEDAVALQGYSKTTKCLSRQAEVLAMSVTDFLQRVRHNEETWNFVQSRAQEKFKFDFKASHLNKKMKFKQVKRNTGVIIPELDVVKPSDFFKLSFGGERIPYRKMNRIMNRMREAPLLLEDEMKGPEVLLDERVEEKTDERKAEKIERPKFTEKVVEFNADKLIGRVSSTF